MVFKIRMLVTLICHHNKPGPRFCLQIDLGSIKRQGKSKLLIKWKMRQLAQLTNYDNIQQGQKCQKIKKGLKHKYQMIKRGSTYFLKM